MNLDAIRARDKVRYMLEGKDEQEALEYAQQDVHTLLIALDASEAHNTELAKRLEMASEDRDYQWAIGGWHRTQKEYEKLRQWHSRCMTERGELEVALRKATR